MCFAGRGVTIDVLSSLRSLRRLLLPPRRTRRLWSLQPTSPSSHPWPKGNGRPITAAPTHANHSWPIMAAPTVATSKRGGSTTTTRTSLDAPSSACSSRGAAARPLGETYCRDGVSTRGGRRGDAEVGSGGQGRGWDTALGAHAHRVDGLFFNYRYFYAAFRVSTRPLDRVMS